MPPKERLNKEDIVNTAYELLRTEGIDALNARALAAKMGCSTMPLFRHFSGMEEIRRAAIERAAECYYSYIRQGLSEPIAFKGSGRAYIRFAKEEPLLFKLFFVLPSGTVPELPLADATYGQVIEAAADSAKVDLPQAARLHQQMWVFVHGIAVLVASGKLDWDEEEIGRQLSEVFSALRNQIYEREENSRERH